MNYSKEITDKLSNSKGIKSRYWKFCGRSTYHFEIKPEQDPFRRNGSMFRFNRRKKTHGFLIKVIKDSNWKVLNSCKTIDSKGIKYSKRIF